LPLLITPLRWLLMPTLFSILAIDDIIALLRWYWYLLIIDITFIITLAIIDISHYWHY
jgi:hypothetical protein